MLTAPRQVAIGACLLLIGFIVASQSESLAFIMAIAAVWALMASGWNLISGYAGPVSLGQGAFFGLTSFLTTLLFAEAGISPYLGILFGVFSSLVLAAVVGAITLRLSGLYFALATLTIPLLLGTITRFLGVFEIPRPYVGESIAYMQFGSSVPYYAIAAVMVLLVMIFTARMEKSRTGRYLVAIRENERAASAAGIPVYRYKFVAFMWGALCSSVAGGLFSQLSFVFNTEEIYNVSVSVQALLIVLIGGSGTVLGPLIGAAIVIPLTEVTKAYFSQLPGLSEAVYASILLVVALGMRGGVVVVLQRRLLNASKRKNVVQADKENISVESQGPEAAR